LEAFEVEAVPAMMPLLLMIMMVDEVERSIALCIKRWSVGSMN